MNGSIKFEAFLFALQVELNLRELKRKTDVSYRSNTTVENFSEIEKAVGWDRCHGKVDEEKFHGGKQLAGTGVMAKSTRKNFMTESSWLGQVSWQSRRGKISWRKAVSWDRCHGKVDEEKFHDGKQLAGTGVMAKSTRKTSVLIINSVTLSSFIDQHTCLWLVSCSLLDSFI